MLKINIASETKKNLKTFSIFFGIIIGMTIILITATLLSRNSWRSGLGLEMQKVLDSYSHGKYTVGKYVPIESNLSASTAVYTLVKKDGNKSLKHYGVIARIPSMLGPLPAVFIYNERDNVIFVGYAVDNGKAQPTVEMAVSNNIIKYWEELIPKIILKLQVN